MASLDPNQQLAMAASQLQQQQAVPGAYNVPSYVTDVERTATTLTMGLTEAALPAASLLTSIGLTSAPMLADSSHALLRGFGGSRLGGLATMSPGRWSAAGRAVGGAVGSLAGSRAIGGMIGSAAGFGASYMAPLAIAEVYNKAAERMIEGQREFLATRQLVRELPSMGRYGPQSLLTSGTGPAHMAADPRQISALQSNLSSIGASYGATAPQMRNLTEGLAGAGMLDTSSVQSVSRSLRSSMQELKQISQLVGTDLQEAVTLYTQLRNMGFGNTGSRTQALRKMSGAAGLSGMSLSAVGGVVQNTMGLAGQLGLNPLSALDTATSAVSNSAYRVSSGLVNPLYLQRVGGMEGYASRMAEIQVGAAGSQGAMAAMSHLFTDGGRARSGGMEDLMSGGRLRSRGSFNRNFDPYQLGAMRRSFSEMSDSVILGGVNSIQARYGEDRAAANRRQYEFLSQFGIEDPDEQQEYVSSLRSRPRADAMQAAQQLRNAATTSGGRPASVNWEQRLSDAVDGLVRSLVGGGDALERYGASLQVRAERVTSQAYDAVLGRPSSMATGMYTQEALDYTSSRMAQGGGTFHDPMRAVQRRMGTAPWREALAADSNITGTTAASSSGAVYRMAYGATSSLNALAGGRSGQNRVFGRGSFFDSYGRSVGATGQEGTGQFIGVDSRGRRRYATDNEFMQMFAAEHNAAWDSQRGDFARADQSDVSSLLYHQGSAFAAVENDLIYSPRNQGRVSSTGRTMRGLGGFARSEEGAFGSLGRVLGWSSEDVLGQGGDYQLTMTQREGLRRDRFRYLDEFSAGAYGTSYAQSSAQQQANLLEALRQSPGQIGAELAGERSDLSAAGGAASLSHMQARASFGMLIGEGDYRSDVSRRASSRMVSLADLRSAEREDMAAVNAQMRGLQPSMVQLLNDAGLSRDGYVDSDSARRLFEGRGYFSMVEKLDSLSTAASSTPDSARSAQQDLATMLNLTEEAKGELSSLFDGGQALRATGAIRGAAQAGTSREEMLRRFVERGEGFGAGAEIAPGLASYAIASAGSGYQAQRRAAADIDALLSGMSGSVEGGSEQESRLNLARQSILDGGNLRAVEGLTPGTLQQIRRSGSQVVERTNQVASSARDAMLFAGNAVLQERSADTMGVLRRNQLAELTTALGTSKFTVNGQEYTGADIRQMLARGTITADFANEIFNSSATRSALEQAAEEAEPGSAALATIDRLSSLTTGESGNGETRTASTPTEQLSSQISQSFDAQGRIDASKLDAFRGTGVHTYLSAISRVQQSGSSNDGVPDIGRLRETFGEEGISALLTSMEVSGSGTSDERVQRLIQRLESPTAGTSSALTQLFASTAGLGVNGEADEASRGAQRDRDDFYSGMANIIRNSPGDGLAVSIRSAAPELQGFFVADEGEEAAAPAARWRLW